MFKRDNLSQLCQIICLFVLYNHMAFYCHIKKNFYWMHWLRGVSQNPDESWRGGLKTLKLADIVCGQPLITSNDKIERLHCQNWLKNRELNQWHSTAGGSNYHWGSNPKKPLIWLPVLNNQDEWMHLWFLRAAFWVALAQFKHMPTHRNPVCHSHLVSQNSKPCVDELFSGSAMISQQHNLILNDFVAVKRAKPETASHLRRQSHLQVVRMS